MSFGIKAKLEVRVHGDFCNTCIFVKFGTAGPRFALAL